MRDLTVELKQLRLHGMATAWSELVEPDANAVLEDSRWLIEHHPIALRGVSRDPSRSARRAGPMQRASAAAIARRAGCRVSETAV